MPQLGNLPEFMNDGSSHIKKKSNEKFGIESDKLKIYDYSKSMESMLDNRNRYSHPIIPSIFVRWDNSPRRGENGIVITNDDSDRFRHYLEQVVTNVKEWSRGENLFFINAWNE